MSEAPSAVVSNNAQYRSVVELIRCSFELSELRTQYTYYGVLLSTLFLRWGTTSLQAQLVLEYAEYNCNASTIPFDAKLKATCSYWSIPSTTFMLLCTVVLDYCTTEVIDATLLGKVLYWQAGRRVLWLQIISRWVNRYSEYKYLCDIQVMILTWTCLISRVHWVGIYQRTEMDRTIFAANKSSKQCIRYWCGCSWGLSWVAAGHNHLLMSWWFANTYNTIVPAIKITDTAAQILML